MNLSCFWAKKSDRGGTPKWLPLIEHLKDTAYVIDRLWEIWLDDSQRAMIVKTLSSMDEGKKLAKFLAYSHDVSKSTAAFQTKKSFTNSPDLDEMILEKLERAGFNGIKNLQLANPTKSHHSIAGQVILEEFGVNRGVASIVGAHHGSSVDSVDVIKSQLSAYSANYYGEELKDGKENLFNKSQEELFKWILKSVGYDSVEDIPEITVPVQMILTGLLIMADWIASNETYYPLIPIDDTEVIDREKRNVEGFEKWRKSEGWTPYEIYDASEIYNKRFGFDSPREEQRKIFDVIDEIEEPGIIIFEAPMGMGKTEASLIAVEQIASKLGKSGLFFGLPTQATSNGIFPRINDKWLMSISKEFQSEFPIRLSHGKAYLNEDYKKIARRPSSNIYEDEFTPGTFVNEWFSGRKTSSLDDFVVGTVDQFLMMSLKQKHLFLRHLGFSKKVVVIDEVHSYDTFSSEHLYQSVKWAAVYNIPIIILSATLPASKRKLLIKNYMIGKGANKKELRKQISALDTNSYPLITYNDGFEVKQFKDFDIKHDKTIKIIRTEEDNLINLLEEISKEGGIIGIVVNTVKKSQKFAEELSSVYGSENVLLLHSSFIATDRTKKEDELLKLIGGRPEDRPKFKIIIGTQVIEQSLDIDFDVMISDLAPMDLLIQRMGRLFRHKNERPEILKDPKFYVLGCSEALDFDKGSMAVYDGYILMRTENFLPDEIKIPEDISPLVQKVYGDEDIELNDDLNGVYEDFKHKYIAYNEKKKERASNFKLGEPYQKSAFVDNNNLIGILSDKKDFRGKTEEQIYAQVRDIKETIEVIALKKIGDGYGIFGEDVDLSKDIENSDVQVKIAKNTLRLPQALAYSPMQVEKNIKFLEDYNIKNLPQWQETTWLKGSLGIIFDENNEFTIGELKLMYDEKLGLLYERL